MTRLHTPRGWRRVLRSLALALAALMVAACGGRVELLSDAPEAEANEVLAALASAGIESHKVPGKDGMVKLVIDQSLVARAISALDAEGLPRPRYATMGDVFRKEGLISSPLEERARYIWALSQELSATVAQIDGVLRARVHVVLPERGSGGEPGVPSSAAVFIKYQRGYSLQGAIPQVRQLVSNSVPGLAAENVSVVLVPAQPRPAEVTSAAAAAAAAPPLSPAMQLLQSSMALWAGLGLVALVILACGAYVARTLWLRRARGTALVPMPAPEGAE